MKTIDMVRTYRASENVPEGPKVALTNGDRVLCRSVLPWDNGDIRGTVINADTGEGTVIVEGADGVWLEMEPARLEKLPS